MHEAPNVYYYTIMCNYVNEKAQRYGIPDCSDGDSCENVCEQVENEHSWSECCQLQSASALQQRWFLLPNRVHVGFAAELRSGKYLPNTNSIHQTHDGICKGNAQSRSSKQGYLLQLGFPPLPNITDTKNR